MTGFIIDASLALAWFLPGEQTQRSEVLLGRTLQDGALAPGLWPVEVANVLLTAERKGRVEASYRVSSLAKLRKLPVEIDTETATRAWSKSFDLAHGHNITVYDATYLELALRSGLPLATLDKALAKAATASGVPVLGYVEGQD